MKKKRGRMVFDPITKDWVPRYGANSIKKIAERNTPVIEVKKNANPYEDPFIRRKLE